MRQLKFRQWEYVWKDPNNKDKKKAEEMIWRMTYFTLGDAGGWVDIDNSDENNQNDGMFYGRDYDGSRPARVMQYTGLKDKNGKEIYEGDFIKAKNMFWIIEEMNWTGLNIWCVNGKYKGCVGDICRFQDDVKKGHIKIHPNHMEVVDNIYENKDLLE